LPCCYAKNQEMLTLIKQEPVLFQALIQAGLALALSFGANLSAGQVGTILAFTAALLSFVTRTQVTAVANPKTNDGTKLVPEAAKAQGKGAGS